MLLIPLNSVFDAILIKLNEKIHIWLNESKSKKLGGKRLDPSIMPLLEVWNKRAFFHFTYILLFKMYFFYIVAP